MTTVEVINQPVLLDVLNQPMNLEVLNPQIVLEVSIDGGPVLELGLPVGAAPDAGGGVGDGDKGNLTVAGDVWSINAGVITNLMLGASAIALFAPAVHGHTIAQITGLQAALDGKATAEQGALADSAVQPGALAAGLAGKQDALGFAPENAANKGVAGGYAALDGTGRVPAAQLPSFVDDVIEAANFAALPAVGETGKIYVTVDTNPNRSWRWSGTVYVEISGSPGSTDAVVEGATNLYFTSPRVRATDLTGYAAAGSRTALVAGDTILGAFGKVGKWLGDLGSAAFAAASAAGLAMLTAANAAAQTALLATFTSAAKGLVPAPGTPVGNFLKDDGTWAAAAGGGATNLSYDAATREVRSDTGSPAVLPLATNTTPGLAARGESGPSLLRLFEDYVGNGTGGFVQSASGGSTAGRTDNLNEGVGWLNFNCNTNTTSRVMQALNPVIQLGIGEVLHEARLKVITISDAVNGHIVRTGLIDNLLGDPTDGCFFRYTDILNGGRWQAVCRSNNVETGSVVDTGVTVDLTTVYELKVVVNPTGTSAAFHINGALVATITTNIPTGTARQTGAGIHSNKTAGTTALTLFAVDYQLFEHSFTGPRA